ncbi:MAG: oxidoreductase [Sinimarinibacterium sp.]|jgi:NAD(P)-dependent dehydrogenase (short-subunit alcohol dehydrogenase family)
MTRWTERDIPDLAGKLALVTGANSGLGLATAQALAAHGAHVVLTCRGQAKADAAMAQIRARTPKAKLEFLELDLSDLTSVRHAADTFKARHKRLDILVNNAGVMGLPLMHTKDGFELLFGTNHLGHFAFAGLLFDRLRAASGARIVAVASLAHWTGRMPLDDLNWERRRYNKAGAYSQSKLANLMFALELQRRLDARSVDVLSLAAHPGYAATNIFFGGEAAQESLLRSLWTRAAQLGAALFAQPAELGALPSLYAATAPDAVGGGYYGPNGPFEARGYPKRAYISPLARNARVAAELWTASEHLTGVRWDL